MKIMCMVENNVYGLFINSNNTLVILTIQYNINNLNSLLNNSTI